MRDIFFIAGSLVSSAAHACGNGSVALFSCDAANSRKFIELCTPSPLDAQSGYMFYRFGSLDKDENETAVELEFPANAQGSLKRFYAATYTDRGVYIDELKGLVPCDPETPVGTACVR